MDKRIRLNEICIIGLPRCDFAFSSTRTCFIAFGYEESPLEMTILRKLLEQKGIQPVEASGTLAPGQNAFCAKICSKIITAQFCIVLINNDKSGDKEIPNANVNMEYGLMLGFNKYVIPFQRASQNLPFNVAGLDTIKYSDRDFERLASDAIDQAILETQQESVTLLNPNQILELFLLRKKTLVTPLNTEGEKTVYQMGAPLGFNLLNDFSAMKFMFFGNFTALRPEVVLWRLQMLQEILKGRKDSLEHRLKVKIFTPEQMKIFQDLFDSLQIWVVVTTNEEKEIIAKEIASSKNLLYNPQIFSIEDVESDLKKLSATGA